MSVCKMKYQMGIILADRVLTLSEEGTWYSSTQETGGLKIILQMMFVQQKIIRDEVN